MIYADPGSGILIWQLLLALFFGTTFFFTKLRHWVASKLRPNHDNETLKAAAEDYTAKSISKGE
jgi:hypothetical protein